MGTRSLTKVIQTWDDRTGEIHRRPITCMYRQYDGHLESHGLELAEWLDGFTIVNGIPSDRSEPMFNGMDCLAAQMFVHFKSSGCKDDGTPTSNTGGIYCMHPDAYDVFEEYVYEIEEVDGKIFITAYQAPPTGYDGLIEVFKGTPNELLIKIKENVEH